jgi:hypothetical protein
MTQYSQYLYSWLHMRDLEVAALLNTERHCSQQYTEPGQIRRGPRGQKLRERT